MHLIYQALIQPHFDYCNIVWGNCGITLQNKIQKLQNRAARVLTNSNYDADAGHLFELLGWKNLASQQQIQRATMVYKGTGKRGHIVADTLLLMMFLGRANARDTKRMLCFHGAQTGKHLLRTQILCPPQMLRARANGETFVSATMCPQQCVLVCQYLKSLHGLAPDYLCYG